MTTRPCSIAGCTRPHKARGWCATHYLRWRTHGDPTVCTTNRHLPVNERFWMKVQKSPGCWNWTAATSVDGYGVFGEHMGGKQHKAHRYAYEQLIGPIPEGKLLDHKCHNRDCVNPDHLRPVTIKQNNENRIGASRNSKTGVRGVSYNTKDRRYIAVSKHYGKPHYGGSFTAIEEAAEAVKALRLSLHTHNDADRKSA